MVNKFAYRFIATRVAEADAQALDRILARRRVSIYSLLRLILSSYINLADPGKWKDEQPPLDLLRYIVEGTKEQREAMRAAAQEEAVASMFNDIRYEREGKRH